MAARRVRRVRVAATETTAQPPPDNPAVASPNFSDAQLQTLQQMISSSISSVLQAPVLDSVSPTPNREVPLLSPGKAEACGHVSISTREKIKRGEYIELNSLLPPTPGYQVEESLAKQIRLSEDDGQLVLSTTSGAAKRKLDNLAAWLEAWSIYCSILCVAQSDRASELIAYQLRIVQPARKYRWPAVSEYDMCFRQKAAYIPALQWDTVDTDLYTRCFTGQTHIMCTLCKRSGHAATSCVLRSQTQSQREKSLSASPVPTCGLFNRGSCSYNPCRFRHKCNSCGGDHPVSSCKRQAS